LLLSDPKRSGRDKGIKQATEALEGDLQKGVTFISRGDESGTHVANGIMAKGRDKTSVPGMLSTRRDRQETVPTFVYTNEKSALYGY